MTRAPAAVRIAIYARYSSDAQREASIGDQVRNCNAFAQRQGWPAATVYSDHAISGARNDRPGYLALLAAAHEVDIILVDDLSRLSRDSAELALSIRRLRFAGARVIGVSDGVDTARKGHKTDVGLRGLMGELYLDDLADKTHRGLTGRALAGSSAGGLPYGYRVTTTGERAIDPDEADTVRRIYRDYLAGHSARDIAAALNRERVPSPRGSTWAMSAIYGDRRRGIGILCNPIYTGRQVWNRSHWIKHPDTGRRVRQERPESEWIITDKPELAIVDPTTWAAAQQRLETRSVQTAPDKPAPRGGPGRPNRHLLSGLLRCGHCGGPLVIIGRNRYGCSRHKERGATVCPGTRVPQAPADTALVQHLIATLGDDRLYAALQTAVTAALKRAQPDTDTAQRRLAAAERTRDNIAAALRAGIITPTTRAELIRAEADIAEAQTELERLRTYQPTQIIPRLRERWRTAITTLTNHHRNTTAAREAIATLAPAGIPIRTNENGDLFAEIAASNCSQIKLVAGAGFGLYLPEPLLIPIPQQRCAL